MAARLLPALKPDSHKRHLVTHAAVMTQQQHDPAIMRSLKAASAHVVPQRTLLGGDEDYSTAACPNVVATAANLPQLGAVVNVFTANLLIDSLGVGSTKFLSPSDQCLSTFSADNEASSGLTFMQVRLGSRYPDASFDEGHELMTKYSLRSGFGHHCFQSGHIRTS